MKASKEWGLSLKPGITLVQKSRKQRDTDFTFQLQGRECEKIIRYPWQAAEKVCSQISVKPPSPPQKKSGGEDIPSNDWTYWRGFYHKVDIIEDA